VRRDLYGFERTFPRCPIARIFLIINYSDKTKKKTMTYACTSKPDPQAASEACAHHMLNLLGRVLSGKADKVTLAVSAAPPPHRDVRSYGCHAFRAWTRWASLYIIEPKRCVHPTDDQSTKSWPIRSPESARAHPPNIPRISACTACCRHF